MTLWLSIAAVNIAVAVTFLLTGLRERHAPAKRGQAPYWFAAAGLFAFAATINVATAII